MNIFYRSVCATAAFAFVLAMGFTALCFCGASESMAADGQASGQRQKVLSDQPYVENGHERQKLDLYLPAGGSTSATADTAKYPLIIWVHGGGWAAGSKDRCPAQRLTAQGFAVASINYRLSSHAIFPAQIEDCKAAVRWLRANAAKYQLDPDRFGVWGSSAGGHLVALMGTTGNAKQYDVGPNLQVSSAVQAVCDFYGPTDFLQLSAKAHSTARMDHDSADSPESKLIGTALQQAKDKTAKANPITYIATTGGDKVTGKDLPPYLIVHGSDDPVVPVNQSELLFAALKDAGGQAHLHIIDGAGHGKGFGGSTIEEMVEAFFKRTLVTPAKAPAERTTLTRSKASEERRGPAMTAGATPPSSATVSPTTQSPTSQTPIRPPGPAQTERNPTTPRGRITWDEVCRREGIQSDGQISRDKFRGPPAVFARLDRNSDGVLTKVDFESAAGTPASVVTPAPSPTP